MATNLLEEQKAEIRERGYGFAGYIGGAPKIQYWTPDGREVWLLPAMRQFIRRDANGNAVGSGVRDANFDSGLLAQKPTVLKPYCPHCDKWHDTQEEIIECGKGKKIFITKHTRLGRKELKQDDNSRMDKLERDMVELKTMIKQLLGGK